MREPQFGHPIEACALRGSRVAALLYRWWQSDAPAAVSVDELGDLGPQLMKMACGGIGWHRFRDTPLADSAIGRELQQAHRLHTLRAAISEQQLNDLFPQLRAVGLSPILAKGWAIARSYPEPGLRPYSDFDLYVDRKEMPAAQAFLSTEEGRTYHIDLHLECPALKDRSWQELRRRARTETTREDVEILMMGAEDHLRYICLHALGHSLWRPLWLCDVALLVEQLPRDFDFAYFWKGDSHRNEAVACVLALSAELLGAVLPEELKRPDAVPEWVRREVLQLWGDESYEPPGRRRGIGAYGWQPLAITRALWQRWPMGLEATLGVGGSIHASRRWPYQIAEGVRRTLRFFG